VLWWECEPLRLFPEKNQAPVRTDHRNARFASRLEAGDSLTHCLGGMVWCEQPASSTALVFWLKRYDQAWRLGISWHDAFRAEYTRHLWILADPFHECLLWQRAPHALAASNLTRWSTHRGSGSGTGTARFHVVAGVAEHRVSFHCHGASAMAASRHKTPFFFPKGSKVIRPEISFLPTTGTGARHISLETSIVINRSAFLFRPFPKEQKNGREKEHGATSKNGSCGGR
jgi:hypothetical protein